MLLRCGAYQGLPGRDCTGSNPKNTILTLYIYVIDVMFSYIYMCLFCYIFGIALMFLVALKIEEIDISPLESNDILMFRLMGVPQVFISV